jgi:Rps23 Pro-64 3,4-dihydroxylase Tpa1-like proline 4-hydroxylase
MSKHHILSKTLFEPQTVGKLKNNFANAEPFSHVVIDNFLEPEFALEISRNFPPLASMQTKYNGLNEKKSEDSNFENLHSNFSLLHQRLMQDDFREWLSSWTNISSLHTINDRLGYGLHQGGNTSFLDIHIDYNVHPIQKLLRKLNLILFFNENWQTEWGGKLELWDKDVANCMQSITPIINRCVIFECSEISYHGYNKIQVPENVTRKSYYQYFFTPLPASVAFHDTVFKARPKESLVKKIATPVKEMAKNSVKKTLLKLGWKSLLK